MAVTLLLPKIVIDPASPEPVDEAVTVRPLFNATSTPLMGVGYTSFAAQGMLQWNRNLISALSRPAEEPTMNRAFLGRVMLLGIAIVLGTSLASAVSAAPIWSAAGPGTVVVTDADIGDDGG